LQLKEIASEKIFHFYPDGLIKGFEQLIDDGIVVDSSQYRNYTMSKGVSE
jgi:hypothetical protein